MAQKYYSTTAHQRMDAGLCPECGREPGQHGDDPRFWEPGNQRCNLLEKGVVERVEQRRKDVAGG